MAGILFVDGAAVEATSGQMLVTFTSVVRAEARVPNLASVRLLWNTLLAMSISGMHKRRGRPATGKNPHVVVRMEPAAIERVDAFAESNEINRSEAVRRLVEKALRS